MMASKRHEALGIKQEIRFEWMQKAVNLILAGLDAKAIRQELHKFLAEKKGNGSKGGESEMNRSFAVGNIMKIWVSPYPELFSFREASLAFLREHQPAAFAVHWAMISAVYPFWFNVAKQTGRLLSLQEQVTQIQIINRLKEQYGDRPTVSRYARYVIRSFIACGAIKDCNTRGCYEKAAPEVISDKKLAILMLESALHSDAGAKGILRLLLSSPAFFPFRLPAMTGDFVSRSSDRIEVAHYGLDEELLKLRAN